MATINFNGTDIKVTSRYQGTATPWEGKYIKHHHRVKITANGVSCTFSYYNNTERMDKAELMSALYCAVGDAISYKNAEDILDFANEFGYELRTREERQRLRDVWNGCKDAYEKMLPMRLDIYALSDYLQETFNL